ncbi:MAG: hypothetical protein IKX68_07500 [Clostridiales bacterium]|nr:hypothetical protein [Clostridiales bacterium]
MKVFKKIISIACAAAVLMGISAASTVAFTKEADTIIVDGKTFNSTRNCKGDNWKYNAGSHTLSLNGYNGMYIDLGTQESVVIELSGENNVVSHVASPAILVEGDLLITGEGSLSLDVDACHSAVCAQGGSLTIENTTVSVTGNGVVSDSGYLLMADKTVSMTGTRLSIVDEISGSGGAIGSMSGDILVNEGCTLTVFSSTKGIAAISGKVSIRGEGTEAEILATENSVYAKSGISVEEPARLRAESKNAVTSVYCPEGNIVFNSVVVDISSESAAMAAKSIQMNNCYINDPFDCLISEVSELQTVTLYDEVWGEVHIIKGIAPTPTPSPTPTPTPIPSPTTEPEEFGNTSRGITPRMIIGGVLVVAALSIFAVILVKEFRSRSRYRR